MPATQFGSNGFLAADFARHFEEANEQAKSVLAVQKELVDAVAQMNEHWLERAKSEAEFTTTMASKFVAARSMPDMTSVYQDWFAQRMQRCVEDGKHVFDDVQTLIRTGTRLAHNGKSRA